MLVATENGSLTRSVVYMSLSCLDPRYRHHHGQFVAFTLYVSLAFFLCTVALTTHRICHPLCTTDTCDPAMMLADGRDIQSHRSLLLSLISTRRFAHPLAQS
jgi:hypothetical protein